LSLSEKPLVMRLMIGDMLRLEKSPGETLIARIATTSGNGQIFMAAHNEANADARNRDKSDPFAYVSKMPGSLQKAKGRSVRISPIGQLQVSGT
jgi:CRISPR-associated endonuclease Csn1